jgi:hypothetical protein
MSYAILSSKIFSTSCSSREISIGLSSVSMGLSSVLLNSDLITTYLSTSCSTQNAFA